MVRRSSGAKGERQKAARKGDPYPLFHRCAYVEGQQHHAANEGTSIPPAAT
jgi:hypothetical protein